MWERRNGRRNAFGIPCRLQRQEKHEPGIYFSVRRTPCPGREGGGFSGIKLFRRRTERVLMIFSIFSRFAKDAASGRICSQLPQELAALPSICWKEPWFLRGFETCGFLGAFFRHIAEGECHLFFRSEFLQGAGDPCSQEGVYGGKHGYEVSGCPFTRAPEGRWLRQQPGII